jgi:hypothetical protein
MNKKIIVILSIIFIILIGFLFKCKVSKPQLTAIPNVEAQGSTYIKKGDISIKIWDNNTEDGDSVRVSLDGVLLKDSLALLYEPVILKVGLLDIGEHNFVVEAINEGSSSPATATISISNEKESHELVMDASIGTPALWKIHVQ